MTVTTVSSTVNRCFRESLPYEKLAQIIKSGRAVKRWQGHLAVFFTEVAVCEILRFAREHGISRGELKRYYERHIKKLYRNQELEDALKYD